MVQHAKISDEDRRTSERATMKTSIHFGSESNFYSGFTNDISQGGLFVATHNVAPVGTTFQLEFSLPDSKSPIRVKGEVRWFREYNPTSDGSPGLGLSFIDLTDEDRSRIDQFVRMRETLFFDDE